jgi:hypothetical protein
MWEVCCVAVPLAHFGHGRSGHTDGRAQSRQAFFRESFFVEEETNLDKPAISVLSTSLCSAWPKSSLPTSTPASTGSLPVTHAHRNFKLFLHTKLSNPHYPPEIQAETTLINFTVTEAGLEDQLLALVVNKERPDLEETKTQLIVQNTEFTIKLKQLEDELLFKLSNAEGDITEDVALIESLEESKRVATEINEKVRGVQFFILTCTGARIWQCCKDLVGPMLRLP